ncbi:hypothetical protein GGS26DRAFT_559345 [Hypomontagnella submonticulosa]|nr:hypothetical protein GGS26DRAFT_559345 [Hypomontagnella submonticulosa]
MSSPYFPGLSAWETEVDFFDQQVLRAAQPSFDFLPLLDRPGEEPFRNDDGEKSRSEPILEKPIDSVATPGQTLDPAVLTEQAQRRSSDLAQALQSLISVADHITWDDMPNWHPEDKLAFFKTLEDSKHCLYGFREDSEETSETKPPNTAPLNPNENVGAEMGSDSEAETEYDDNPFSDDYSVSSSDEAESEYHYNPFSDDESVSSSDEDEYFNPLEFLPLTDTIELFRPTGSIPHYIPRYKE